MGAAVAVLAGRRRWNDEEVGEPADDAPGAPAGAEPDGPDIADFGSSAPVATSWIAGPVGNLFIRDSGGSELGNGVAMDSAGLGSGFGDLSLGPERTEARRRPLPVLFVHGLAGNGGQWALQVDHLSRFRRALALDLRGHGDSDAAELELDAEAPEPAAEVPAEGVSGSGYPSAPGGPYGVAALAGDVAAVADALALRRFVLVGHSLGAAVAIAYAAAHPRRVAGLVLADPNGDQTRIPRSQMEPFLTALRADPLRELETYFRQLVAGGDREVAGWVLEDLQLTDEGAIAAAVEGALHFSPVSELARYPGPRLAVISAMNTLPYSLHRLVPDLPVELMRGTGHWLMMDRPEVFNHILDDFLERVDG
jgi:pimeloyl-ACP methyl ester carboxylesterase